VTGTATHEVIRPIPGMPGLRAGDLVDASGWRTAEKMERARYIKPITDGGEWRSRAVRAEARVSELEAELRQLRGGAKAAAARR
jgi:hypothetical protein